MMRTARQVVPLAVLLLVAGAIGVFVLSRVLDRTDRNAEKTQTAQARAGVAKRKTDKVERQVRQVERIIVRKEIAVRGPNGLRGGPGQVGKTGPAGADGAQGPRGEPGRDARPATVEELTAALVALCERRECRGAKGEQGAKGEPGARGAQGPAVLSFMWTAPDGTSYLCTDANGDLHYECQGPPPAAGQAP